jgi:hypothetical protein
MWKPRVTRHTSIRESISVQTLSSMSLFMFATASMMRCLSFWRSFGRGGLPSWWINSKTCAEQPLHSCYRVGLRKLQDTERHLLWSRHFVTRSPLAAAARNNFPRQLQTKFENFPNNCWKSRDCRLTGYFIINMWKCYLLFELSCIFVCLQWYLYSWLISKYICFCNTRAWGRTYEIMEQFKLCV